MDQFSAASRQSLHSASPLRIGLLLDSMVASQYVYDFVQWAKSHHKVTVTYLISTHSTKSQISVPAGLPSRKSHSGYQFKWVIFCYF